jgi:hypothetical protein
MRVKLTAAQLRVAHDVIKYSEAMGDCELKESTVRFADYEGLSAFQSRVMGAQPTARAFISMQAIAAKIDNAVIAAARRAA